MKRFGYLLILVLLTLSACAPQVTEIPVVPESPTETPTPPPTPMPETRSLTVCLGEEPSTLYPYGGLSSAARSVLSAVYDGPMDVSGYRHEAVILEKVPNLEDGDAQVSALAVSGGDTVVDSSGAVVTLDAGVRVRPSGCRSDSCAINYDGSSQIQMDQMVVTFTMLAGLTWSDGEPLTAEDSIYSFDLAASDETPGSKFLFDRTETYEAADDVTVQWWGVPGFIDAEYYTNFWMPLPQHKWGEFSAADLLQVDVSTRAPMGWGAYIIESWKAGESIHLVKNLNYFRAESGLPKFDELTFLFMPDANAAMTALVDGTCDVLDPSINLDGQVSLLQQMQTDAQAQLLTAQTDTMEWLSFGILPASYDDGYNSTGSNPDRPDFFGDVRTRKAVAYCLDRQKVVDTVLFGLTRVPDSYLSLDHPLHNGNLQTYEFSPASGREILDQVGWIDHDNDPSTPRQSLGVTRVPNGTPLVLNYITTSATQRRQAVEIFSQSLAECGIGVNAVHLNASDLYAQGPAGPLFAWAWWASRAAARA
jgi:peptide/nickel transport system substrate-binding protein